MNDPAEGRVLNSATVLTQPIQIFVSEASVSQPGQKARPRPAGRPRPEASLKCDPTGSLDHMDDAPPQGSER